MFAVSDEWKRTYPGACAGVLAMSDVANSKSHPALEQKKRELEQELRRLFKDPADLKSNRAIQAYRDYYKRFKKSYHVYHQLESVIFRGKSLPSVASLVEAMFIAELRNMLLTAGHDRDAVRPPLKLDVAKGNETYVKLNGEEQLLKVGDMMISDSEGIISSVIYGPDKRTRINPETTSCCSPRMLRRESGRSPFTNTLRPWRLPSGLSLPMPRSISWKSTPPRNNRFTKVRQTTNRMY